MLEVRASGGKTYYQRYMDERGRERQYKIGPADVLTLRQAKRKAMQIKAQAILGSDPQRERQQRRSIPTLRAFIEDRYLPFVRLFVPLSKSGKSRYVVLNADAVAVLRSVPRLPDNPYVFPSPVTGRPSASLYFPWHRIRTRAGLPDVRLHDLRHSFASALVNDGKDLYIVQRLLGHTNAKATQRYSHLRRDTLAEAAETMGKLIGPILKQVSRAPEEMTDDLPSGPLRPKGP